MKKILMIVCAVVLACAACTGKKDAAKGLPSADNIKVGFVYIGSIHDEGYTQAHDRGRLALEAQGIECVYIENVPENADCEKAIRDLIDQGCNVIYTNSFGFMDWTIKVAADFPNVYFGHCSGYKRAANVSTYFGKVYQARYLAGIAAGYKTRANKIGYVAAYPIPEVIRGINAFTLGVQSVNPAATVEVIWTSTWYDPTIEKNGAVELLNKGCDVIAQHQDTTAPQIAAQERGAFAVGYNVIAQHQDTTAPQIAAQERGAFAVGYNVSTPGAAPRAYLTAPLFHWEVFYVDDVNHVLAGDWQSRAYWEGLNAGTVSLDNLTANNDPRAEPVIADAAEKIKNGELEPFTGPLTDQNGEIRVAAGTRMTDDEIWNMGWFVKGVIGIIPD